MPEDMKEEQTSFVDLEAQKQKEIKKKIQKQTPPTAQNPLALLEKFDKLIELKKKQNEILKANTDAMNALTSTLVAQVRPAVEKLTPTKISPEVAKKIQSPPTPQPSETPLPEATPIKSTAVNSNIEEVKGCFTQNLANLLYFTEKETYIKLKPRQFLGSDNFAKIAATIRELGGEYISAGKESHFRLSKDKIPK